MVDTYRAEEVTIVFAGIPVEGVANGTFVNAERNTEAYRLVVGSGGAGARASSADKSGTVTITLLQTSVTNALLTALALIDEKTGDGVGPLAVKDLSGQDVVTAEAAWIQKRPATEYSNEIVNREWVLESDNLEILVAGNAAAIN